MAGKLIGVISDTHGLLRPEAAAALQGCDLLVHAGDIGAEEILSSLTQIAPLVSVRGNNDMQSWARSLPATADVEVLGMRILLLHDVSELSVDPQQEGIHVVVHGHSHRPRSFKLPVTLGFLQIDDGRVQGRTIELLNATSTLQNIPRPH